MRLRLVLIGGLCLLLLAGTPVVKVPGTLETYISNATNIASNAGLLSGAITLTDTGYPLADCELNVPSWSTTVTANTGVIVWLLPQIDGTNYEDGDATNFPARAPDFTFPLRTVSSAQRVARKEVRLPGGLFKALVKNDATGATLQGATTTWTLKCRSYTIKNQ